MDTADWDGLRFVLATARAGSAAGAARALGVTHSTVLRRVQAIEEEYGLRIFDRGSGQYTVAKQAASIVEMARAVEMSINEARRLAVGQSEAVDGVLRLTTTEALMDSLLPPLLSDFRKHNPGIALELVVTNSVLNLENRDADVTIRPSAEPPATLVGMRLGRLDFALYAMAAGDDGGRSGEAFMDWLAFDGELVHSRVGRWQRGAVPTEAIVFRSNSFVALRRMAEAGAGVAVLPCVLGNASPHLRRVGEVPGLASTELWILTHADLRKSLRVQSQSLEADKVWEIAMHKLVYTAP